MTTSSYAPPFKPLNSEFRHLTHAFFSNCALLLLEKADADGGLSLTPGGALKRVHVNWAAEAFDWPGHTPAELYRVNKVLNEEDVFPLWLLHKHLLHTKHARHYKKTFGVTKAGRALIGAPHRAFNEIVPSFLFGVDHTALARGRSDIFGRLPDFLDILNLETHNWVGVEELTSKIFGPSDASLDLRPSSLYVEVLRPLIWCGLLMESADGARENMIRKTPLWQEALSLRSDELIPKTSQIQ